MSIVLSQLKEHQQAKIKTVLDICSSECTITNCPNQHKQKAEKKKTHHGFIHKIKTLFYSKKDCPTQKKLTEIFPFIAQDTIRERIFALGIIPGASIKMMGQSPLKDPILIDLSGHLVSLRKAEADLIIVEMEN